MSRRPIAGVFRRTAEGCVRLCVRLGVHPDLISCASMMAAAAGGVCFWQSGERAWLLIPGVVLCYLRLWLNMLDGMVALASGKASRRGEIFNEAPDRVSDVLIFAGVAHSGWCNLVLGYWVVIFALLTAYVATLGQAVGAPRQFGGVMSKPWRMVALHVGAWAALAVHGWGTPGEAVWGLTILDWTCVVIIAGCVQTMGVRLARIFRALR